MNIPVLQGTIKRRILVNFRADEKAVQRLLPAPFRPKLHDGKAVVGICLIRLEHIRPKFAPEFFGLSSENAAHRIAVLWEENGETREGVYIPRRDTGSFLNHAVGGTLFPGEHHKAVFDVRDNGANINFKMESVDKSVSVELSGNDADELPSSSAFSSLKESSNFFKTGALGYSATHNAKRLDGIILDTKQWRVDALELNFVRSSFYENESVFPKGSIEFDHALIMRNIKHEWHSAPTFNLN